MKHSDTHQEEITVLVDNALIALMRKAQEQGICGACALRTATLSFSLNLLVRDVVDMGEPAVTSDHVFSFGAAVITHLEAALQKLEAQGEVMIASPDNPEGQLIQLTKLNLQ